MSDLTSKQEQVLNLLNLTPRNRTSKGWYMGSTCPSCGKSDKFGVKINESREGKYKNHVSIHCFHGSCELSGSENLLFKLLGRDDLVSTHEYREDLGTLSRLKLKVEVEEEREDLIKRYPPIGYRRMYTDSYLESRGFSEGCFKRYPVGRSKIETKLKDYIVFLVMENGTNKGFVARIDWESDKLKEENKKRKVDRKRLLPKYKNEGGVEFSEAIYGFDEITENTHTVILVEGILDKTNVDRELELYKDEKLKCGCTFGKKISPIQIEKLKSKGVKCIILMYDPDAIQSIKEHSYSLMLQFESVFVGKLVGDKDPGDMIKRELIDVLTHLETPLSYRINSIQKNIKQNETKFINI